MRAPLQRQRVSRRGAVASVAWAYDGTLMRLFDRVTTIAARSLDVLLNFLLTAHAFAENAYCNPGVFGLGLSSSLS